MRAVNDVDDFDCLRKYAINDDERSGDSGNSRVPSTLPFLPRFGNVFNAVALS